MLKTSTGKNYLFRPTVFPLIEAGSQIQAGSPIQAGPLIEAGDAKFILS